MRSWAADCPHALTGRARPKRSAKKRCTFGASARPNGTVPLKRKNASVDSNPPAARGGSREM